MTDPFSLQPPFAAAPGPPAEADVAAEWLSALDAVGFVDWDVESNRLRWDHGAEERLGVPPGSMQRFEDWASFVHPDDLPRVVASIREAVAGLRDRAVYRYRFFRPDGEVRLMEAVSLCWYAGTALVCTRGAVFDITRAEAARNDLARSEAQLRTIIDTVPAAMVIIDAAGIIRGFNGAAEQMFGHAAAEVKGTHVARLMPAEVGRDHDASIARYLATGNRRVIGRTRTMTARRADGREFPVELNVGEFVDRGERFFTGFIRDISEQIEAAERQETMRNRYLRTARLNLLGIVAAGLAHELNQPLAAGANFLAASKLLLEGGKAEAEIAAMLDQASSQIALAGDIIRRLRGFLSRSEHPAQTLALAPVVAEAVELAFVGRDHSRIQLAWPECETAPELMADRVQVLQVLVNLIRNAGDAVGGMTGAAITIGARRDGAMVEIWVADNGPGFDPAVLELLEEAIVSTKGTAGLGLGLGLTICRRMIENWGGTLDCANAPDGARVSFTVPAASV